MYDWRSTALADLCQTVTSGGTPSRACADYFTPAEVPWVKTMDLSDGPVSGYDEWISQVGLANSAAKMLPAGTVLMAMYGATVGRMGYLTEPAACNQAACALVADPTKSDARWLYYALLHIRDGLIGLASGAAQQNLNTQIIRNATVNAPPLTEQRGIAEVLGALDDKITANTRLQRTIDELVQALFVEATAGAEVATLAAVADVNVVSVKPTAGELRYLDIASVSVGTYASPAASPWSSAPGRARRKIRMGDTVWSTVRPNRRSHALILEDDHLLVGSTGLAVLTPKRGRFAYVYEASRTQDFTAYLESVAEGSAYPAVRGDRFMQAPVPLPVESRIAEFEAEAGPLRMRAGAALAESAALAATRDALLPLLMSGKVKVKDAESVVGGMI